MKRMAEAKNRYENIPIPKELSERVMAEVEKNFEKRNGGSGGSSGFVYGRG